MTNVTLLSSASSTLYKFAQFWMQLPMKIIGILAPNIILILAGFSNLPTSIPVVGFIQEHKIASLVIGCALALITLLAAIIVRTPHPSDSGKEAAAPTASVNEKKATPGSRQPDRRWIIATLLSTISFFLSSTILVIVLIRPPWCPASFCSVSRSLPQGSVSDANLVLYPLAVQSTSFEIPGDPLHYSQSRLPQSIGVQHVSRQAESATFRVALGVQSLIQDRYAILIKQVAIVLTSLSPVPHQLNVWTTNPSTSYKSLPFLAVYRGEKTGDILSTTSLSTPPGLIHLLPNEPEQFNIRLISSAAVNLEFRVQLTYVVSNDPKPHTLTLPQVFHVIISDASTWREYRLQQGHFVPVR